MRPRRVRNASNGPATAPMAFWWKVTLSARSRSRTTSAPPTTSEWPPQYLVVECTHDVGAQRQRLLEVGRGEGVVDDEQGAGVVGDRGERLDVADVEQRVGGRLDPDELRLARADRRAHRVDVGDRGRAVLEPPHPLDLVEEAEGAAVRVVGDDHVVAGPAHARGPACPRRPGRRRTRSRAPPPPGPRWRPRGRCGWGWRSGCTRSRRAARRPRPACTSRSRRSAGSPRRSSRRARSRRGSHASRSRTSGCAAARSCAEATEPVGHGGRRERISGRPCCRL